MKCGENMYLKTLSAKGFKSFADKTNIEFVKGINAIVGPNGSGKSNVVDAIRWVMGEQSVKSLRGGGAMTDVIFEGSKSRGQMNIASVKIVFDNTDRYLPVSFDEVEIKRRVYKDGSNEYFLNGDKVRLKDITNLLLDSGIAKESFNIISQDQIKDIISLKPENRRVIFEEASGVLKYKRRKEEAIKKLEKTKENKNRVADIITELEGRLIPLKEERKKALEYQDTKEKMEKLDIAIITEDITNLSFKYKESKENLEKLNKEVIASTTNSSKGEAEIEKYKLKITETDEKIKSIQAKIIELTEKTESLNSRRMIISERKKYEVDDAKLHENILRLKETELSMANEIESLNDEIMYLNKDLEELNRKIDKETKSLNNQKSEKENIQQRLTSLVRHSSTIEIKIENLKDNIENGGALPLPVKSVLSNPKLLGIHNTIGNIIEMDEKYSIAILTSLGAMINNIVTDDEKSAKEAIKYLKNIGRATFFPLNVIKPKNIDDITINKIKNEPGFIAIASSLVKCEKIYENIILNQLGNIIVTDNIENADKISKLINNKYKIVTLTGEIIHIGGSMTGGKIKKARNIISDKYDLDSSIKEKDKILKEIAECENKINEIDYNIKNNEDRLYLLDKEKMLKKDEIESKQRKAEDKAREKVKIIQDIQSTENLINGGLSKEEEEILQKYYDSLNKKEETSKKLANLLRQKENLNESLEEYELSIKKENSLYVAKTNELKELEINVNRLDVKLDNLLNTLNENYSMTYEKAKENYKLDIDYDRAKSEVSKLKKRIKEIGIVNQTAPEEYETVNARYEFLNKQIDDLNNAENTLYDIIEEMDKVMIREFKENFNKINEQFKETFKDLFRGGKAELKLTEPNNILDTGVDIIASPPGKKLSNINALSGGEKTLTAISLLFAIIKTKTSPFCVLDEVEAALDEANVDIFGQYLQKLKNKSEFIVITHKKKTMEYADILYGITMQESGVSKLVSVKLEDVE